MANETKQKYTEDQLGLSKKLRVAPESRNVVFKLISKKNGGINRNPYASFEGIETIYDIGEDDPWKQTKMLKYIKTQEPYIDKDGKESVRDVVGDIEFDSSGTLIVKPHEYPKLVFMRRSNSCETNPYRDESKPALWFEEKQGKSKSEKLTEEIRYHDCIAMIKSFTPSQLKAKCKKLSLNDNGYVEEMQYDLAKVAKENPSFFIKEIGNKEDKIKVIINDALSQGVIELNDGANTYVFCEDEEVITAFDPSSDPEDTLSNFLAKAANKSILDRIEEKTL